MKAALRVVILLSGFSAVIFVLLGACYDANSPNLPPCAKYAAWPDPCDAPDAGDAGK